MLEDENEWKMRATGTLTFLKNNKERFWTVRKQFQIVGLNMVGLPLSKDKYTH